MTNPTRGRPAGPALNLRGVVDLGALAQPPAGPSGAGGGASGGANGAAAGNSAGPGSFVVDVTDQTFQDAVLEISMTVPVVLDFWAEWCGPCKQLSPVLESLATQYGGRLLLAKIDTDANPQLSQAFQIQSIPSVFAVVKGQPLPLFQGAQPEAQVRQVLAELLRVAEANGVSGRLPGGPDQPEDGEPGDEAVEPAEEALPPLHQAAYDAIERDDLDAAAAAYQQALNESPADEMARLGLAQVQLMARVRDADPAAARARAAADPRDVDAQLLAADLDVLEGGTDAAFDRLIATVRLTAGDERDRVRRHLIELFDLVGADDPRVAQARLALANALF